MAEREYSFSITASADSIKAAFAAANAASQEFIAGFKEGFEGGLTDAVKKGTESIKHFGDESKKTATSSLSSFDSIALKITGLVAGLDLAGKAMSAIGGAIAGVFEGINRGGELNDLSQRLGVAVETLSSLELGAASAGVSVEGMATGIQQLSRNMVEAASGSKEAQAGFAALGISVTDSSGKLKSTEEILLAISDRFAGAEDGAAKTGLAMQLLGRSGAQLIPFLNEGAEGLRKWQQISADLGLNLTGELASAMDTVGDAVGIFGAAITGVQNQLAIGMSPALASAAEQLVVFVRDIGIADGTLQNIGASIGEFVSGAVESLIDAFERLSERARDVGWGQAIIDELSRIATEAEPIARDMGVKIGGWIAEGVKAGFDVDWTGLLVGALDFSPTISIFEKIGAAASDAFAHAFSFGPEQSMMTQGADAIARSLEVARVAAEALAASEATAAERSTAAGEAYTSAGGKVAFYGAAAQQAAERSGLLGEATRKTGLALPVVAKGADEAAKAVEKLNQQFQQQVSGLEGGIRAFEIHGDALDAIIEGNLGAADAQLVLNEAIAEAAVEAALAAGYDEERARLIGDLTRLHNEEAQAIRAKNAVNSQRVELNSLQAQIPLMQQAISGAITRGEAERQIAVEMEKQKLLQAGVTANVQQLAERAVEVRDEWGKVNDQFKAIGETGIEVGALIGDAFSQTLDGLIAGTLDFGRVWESFTVSMGKQLFDNLWNEKLNFDEGFKFNILDLVDWVGGVFSGGGVDIGGLFSLGGGSGGSGGSILNLLGLGGGAGGAAGSLLSLVLGAGLPAVGGTFASAGNPGVGAGLAFGGFAADQSLKYLLTNSEFAYNAALKLFGEGGTASLIGSGVGGLSSTLTSLGNIGLGFGIRSAGGGIASAVGSGSHHDATGQLVTQSVSTILEIVGNIFGGGVFGSVLAAINDIIDPYIHELFGLFQPPTRGTMLRMAGESALTNLPVFSGLEENLGDITRSKPRLSRNPDLFAQREELGLDALADIQGFAGIFSQLMFGGERGGADVPIQIEQWTNILTEFFSRMEGDSEEVGLAIRQNLAQAFKEMGIDAAGAFATINDLARNLVNNPDPTHFGEAVSNAQNLGEAVRGTAAIFESELPVGVHIAALALETMTKDGELAFADLNAEGHDTLVNLAEDAENFDKIIAHLFEQGFEIDTEAFETRLENIIDSVTFLGENIGTIFQFENVGVGIEAVMENLKQTVLGTYQEIAAKQLFEGTNFGAVFEPVFAALNRIEEFDLTTATGSQGFMDLLLPALAQGKANLQEYIPILQLMADNWKEIEKIIDEAMEPDDAEKAAIAVEQVFSGLGGILDASLSEGIAVLANGGTYQEALNVFKGTFATGVETALKQAAFNAMVDSVVLQPLIQKWQPALSYVMAAGMANGFDDPRVREAWRIVLQGLGADAEALAPLIFDARLELEDGDAVMRGFFNSLQASIDSIGQSLSGGISSLIRESIDIGIEDGLQAGQKHFAENIGDVMYDVLLDAIVRAFVDSVLVEGILGPVMAEGAALYAAAVDEAGPGGRIITPEEQAGINEWRAYWREVYGIAREEAEELGRWLIEEGVTLPDPEGGNPHDGYYTTRRPTGDVDPIDVDGRRGRDSRGDYDAETEGRRIVEEAVKPPAEALADLIETEVIPGLGHFNDSIESVTRALDALSGAADPGGGTNDGGASSGGRRFPGGRGIDGAAAMGGTFGPGSTFLVGEQGPEVVVYGEDGSMEVIPIDRATMQSLLDGGVPGYARGTDRPGIGDFRNGRGPTRPPGGGGGTGPGLGAPITSPLDSRHPDYVDPRDKEAAGENEFDILVSFNFDNAIEEFARGGSAEDLKEALKTASGEGILEGMMNALVESLAFEEFNEKLSDATREAMKDGVIDAAEAAELGKMAEEFAAGAEASILAMGPAFDAVATAFGLKTEEEVIDALATATATAGDLIGSSLRSALRDPANLTFETFSLSLRQAVYGNIVEGLVDAFIDAAVIQGALAPMLAIITAEFGNLGVAIAAGSAEGIAAASAIILAEIGKIAGIIDDPAFQKAIQDLLDLGKDIADGLGLSFKNTTDTIDNATDGFTTAADAAANACTGECDLEQKLVKTDEKIIQLDAYGRTGGVSDSYWEDVVRDPTTSGVDRPISPNTDGSGTYGNPSWRKDRDWRRQRARDRRRDREEDDWFYDPDIPWEEPPHMAAGGIVRDPTYALIGEAGPEAVIPLSSLSTTGDRGDRELLDELRRGNVSTQEELRALRAEVRDELRAHGNRTVEATLADKHTEVKVGLDTFIDIHTEAKRVAGKAGIPF